MSKQQEQLAELVAKKLFETRHPFSKWGREGIPGQGLWVQTATEFLQELEVIGVRLVAEDQSLPKVDPHGYGCPMDVELGQQRVVDAGFRRVEPLSEEK